MKITITIDFTALAASAQKSPSSTFPPLPATCGSSSGGAPLGNPPLQSQAQDDPLPFAEGIPQRTSDAASDEARWLDLAHLGRLAGALDFPQWSPQEFDHYRNIVLAALAAEPLQASGGSAPPPPPAPVESSAWPEPNPGEFRYKANLKSLFAALRRLP